ncbi:MAG: tRNA preQ1(34) S-adenosylmethionine ribosyltransferase-isomerase QueA [Vicinamibacterales bacterium]|nr:tRNA preQ1(34) S-adenosylmethionine ribosyltransferase-isomerase QueA [Vicinamibacterales bacterium]
MNVAEFAFDLPGDLIAQFPPEVRGTSRLLSMDRASGAVSHGAVGDLPRLLRPSDLLVFNDTRVFPARLIGTREPGGGEVECLLVTRVDDEHWEALVHPGQRMKPGRRVRFERGGHILFGEVLAQRFFGRRLVRLWTDGTLPVMAVIEAIGHIPLPPYIRRPDLDLDRERYQTVFARETGSIAAPTAGLHFTPTLLAALDHAGVTRVAVTLHVGYGTFKPVRAERVEDHSVDEEHYTIPPDTAAAIAAARQAGRRVVAVGTTTTRARESAAAGDGLVTAGPGISRLSIHPGYMFQVVDGLFTNFHLPGSSLLMLVAAFGGHERVMSAYADAVRERYRFYSYGDAMLIAEGVVATGLQTRGPRT